MAKTKTKTYKIVFYSNLILVFGAVILLFAHFIQFTGAASEGFVLGNLNSKLVELKNENKDLNLKSADLQSIDKIKEKSEKSLGMIASTGFDYITLGSGPISLK